MNRPGFSEETILSVARTTLANARTHLAALAEFGVTTATLDQFGAAIQSAEALSRETQQRIELKDLTHDKEQALDACFQWGRKLRVRLQLAFGKNSAEARLFPAKDFQHAINSEQAMMAVMEALLDLADKYQTELAAFGQTPELLAQGRELLNELRTADSAQELKKDTKKQSTRGRYQQFQNLYETVTRLNRIGRLVFENDPATLALFESKWPRASVTAAEEPAPAEPAS